MDTTEGSYQDKYLALEKEFVRFKESVQQLVQTEKTSALRAFTSDVAHDLNQPLNVSKIICQGILRDIEKGRFSQEDVKNDLPEIINQMNKMADTITRIRAPYKQKDQPGGTDEQ